MDENNSKEELEQDRKEDNIENKELLKDDIDNENKIEINNTIKEVSKKTKEKVKYVENKDKKKRKGEKEIVVEYRKPSIFSSILLILIGVAIATIVLLLLYIFKGDREVEVYEEPVVDVEEVSEPEEEPKVETRELDLSIDGEFIKDLYSKIPVSYYVQDVYSYTKTTEANITGIKKMLFVLENMRNSEQYEIIKSQEILDRLDNHKLPDGTFGVSDPTGNYIQEVHKYKIEDVENYYKSVFGSNQIIVREDIDTNLGYVYEYDKQDDCFYCHSYAGGGGHGFRYRNVIDSVEKNEDGTDIYIYDYFIKVKESFSGEPNYVYTYSVDYTTIGEEASEHLLTDIDDSLIEKYKNNGLVKFKHTFKLEDNGNYYWYCCEPVK